MNQPTSASSETLPAFRPGTAAEPAVASSVTMFGHPSRQYPVFISYSHADAAWARWLMRRLESFRVPPRFHGLTAPIGKVGARIAPVFRDRDELPTTSDLGETIRMALRQSATLVVICSPASAKSRWVQEEIVAFKRMGGGARVFAFIVAGEPKAAGADEDCFSPALRRELAPDGTLSPVLAEYVAADARPQGDGREDAFIRLVAGLLGVGFDELRQREQQRRYRRASLIAMLSVIGMAITLGLAAIAWQARNDAQRRQEGTERLVGAMLEDLSTQLAKESRLGILEKTTDQIMAFFESLDPRDLTDTTLMQQASALSQIGQIRIKQLHYAEARAACDDAFNRAATLAGRHPANANMLFDRAQTEYWIGVVHLKLGEFGPANEWLTRYRDSALALARLEPDTLRTQKEVISGYHNLAAVALERGELSKARSGFLGELPIREKLAAANPRDAALQFSVANITSYLGTVAEREGDFAEAAKRYGEQGQRLEALIAMEPDTPHWRRRLADALAFQSFMLALSGHRAEATKLHARIRELLDSLVAQDPSNREWQFARANFQAKEAWFHVGIGETAAASELLQACLPTLEKLAAEKNADRVTKQMLALSRRVDAQALAANRPLEAAAAAAQAVALGKTLLDSKLAGEPELGEYATACVVAGRLARDRGEADLARRHWQAALDVVESRARASNNWLLLDPAARALVLLGRTEEGRAIIAQLTHFGYQPLEPWP